MDLRRVTCKMANVQIEPYTSQRACITAISEKHVDRVLRSSWPINKHSTGIPRCPARHVSIYSSWQVGVCRLEFAPLQNAAIGSSGNVQAMVSYESGRNPVYTLQHDEAVITVKLRYPTLTHVESFSSNAATNLSSPIITASTSGHACLACHSAVIAESGTTTKFRQV